ncbi:regulator of nonsense transcripts 3A-like [Watersipora subatra]|uniref:regulator of nonsense transcripts 3A-like n=1 Tax=Watersipora subatra TaxID=2589382 RepID=UPI00355C9ACF
MSQKKILVKQPVTGKAKPDSLPSKIVVRRLPPSLTKESFLEEVSPLPEHDYFHFEPADRSLGPFALCRAVINFKDVQDLYIFREKFDGYVFVDSRGTEYPAVVEYAPYQKIPLNHRKDHRENTLDDDQEYKKFLENHEKQETDEPVMTLKEVLEQLDAKQRERLAAQNSETPLLAFINKFKIEKKRTQEKQREERRLRDLERKRALEEQRKKRERLRKEAEENKQKTNSRTSAVDDDQRDRKKTNKPGAKAGDSYTSQSTSERPGKGSSAAGHRSSKDDIIVRTLPSGKSKNSKQAVFSEKRPSSVKSSQPASKSGTPVKSSSKAGDVKENSSSESTSGKQEGLRGSSKYSNSAVTVRSFDRRVVDRSTGKYYKGKSWEQDSAKESGKGGTKSTNSGKTDDTSKADDLSARLSSAKLKTDSSESSSLETKSGSKVFDKNLERSSSTTSTASDCKSLDSSEGDGDKPRARNTRYKDRPERAIYNPAARAAERRQRKQVTGSSKAASNDENKPE